MLLRELVTATSGSFGNGGEAATTNPQATPLLHHMAAAHAYIQMFVTVNRTGQNDIRNILVSFLFPVRHEVWDHPYITSAKGLGGWDQKNYKFCLRSVLFLLT